MKVVIGYPIYKTECFLRGHCPKAGVPQQSVIRRSAIRIVHRDVTTVAVPSTGRLGRCAPLRHGGGMALIGVERARRYRERKAQGKRPVRWRISQEFRPPTTTLQVTKYTFPEQQQDRQTVSHGRHRATPCHYIDSPESAWRGLKMACLTSNLFTFRPI
jgi:hypothetical protein